MSNSRQKVAIAIVATLLLVVLGLYFDAFFYNFILSQFDDLNVRFQSTELLGQFNSTINLAISLAILPVLLLLSNFILRDEKAWKTLLILPIMLICGIGFMFFHIYSLRLEMSSMPKISPDIENTFPLSSIHVARYLGIGFLLGAILPTTIFYFTSRNRKS